MTRAELQKAYLEMSEKCSLLEKENADLRKQNEDQKLNIEHLTELVLKRNKVAVKSPTPTLKVPNFV